MLAGALVNLGVVKGDRVLIYMPLIPEAIISMLAVVRIGAVHSVVFGGKIIYDNQLILFKTTTYIKVCVLCILKQVLRNTYTNKCYGYECINKIEKLMYVPNIYFSDNNNLYKI